LFTISTGETGPGDSNCRTVELFIEERAAQPWGVPSKAMSREFL